MHHGQESTDSRKDGNLLTNGENMSDLEQVLDGIEDLEVQIRDLATIRREAFIAAKSAGYDTKIIRKVLKIRKNKKAYNEEISLVEAYLSQLGK